MSDLQNSPKQPTCISWSAHSVSGAKKPVNDDAWLALAANPNRAELLESEGSYCAETHDLIFAVSDGMGGNHSGDVASQFIIEQLSKFIPKALKLATEGFYPDYLNYLSETVQAVSLEINEHAAQDPKKKGMGATLALAWFAPESLHICNVGDSRIYLHRSVNDDSEAQTQQLTEDHSFAWRKMQRGEISEREYRSHPRRSVLYEAVGGGHRSVKPFLTSVPYQAGDKFIICSDGLIDGLWDKHIHAGLSDRLDKPADLKTVSEELLARAVSNDGQDDTTLITLQVK